MMMVLCLNMTCVLFNNSVYFGKDFAIFVCEVYIFLKCFAFLSVMSFYLITPSKNIK